MPQLTRIRRHIVETPREWAAVRGRVEIHGEQLKRAPAGFSASHEFGEACERAAPLVRFQTKALGLRW